MTQPRNRFQVLLDAESARAARGGDTRVSPRAPDVPDPRNPAGRRDAPTAHDRLLGHAPGRGVVERVRAQHQGDAPSPPVTPARAPRAPQDAPAPVAALSRPSWPSRAWRWLLARLRALP